MGKRQRLISVREVWVLLPTKIVRIGIRVMVRPRLEVIHISYMLTRGRGIRLLNLTIFCHLIMGTISVTSKG